jgi:hypothetical protein
LRYFGSFNGLSERRLTRIDNIAFDLEKLDGEKKSLKDKNSVGKGSDGKSARSLMDVRSEISKRRGV